MTELDKLIEAVEAGYVSDWAFGSGYPRIALGDKWEAGMNAYCGSLDAALALHEALLPGHWLGEMGGRRGLEGKNWYVQINHTNGKHVFFTDAVSDTPARAWLLAILRAYRSVQA